MNAIPKIIFENENAIAVDKPSGFLSVPSRMGTADPRPVVGILLQNYVGRPIFPVHRLDEETSGILIFAKTPKAQTILSRSFETHTVQKTYQALTELKPGFDLLMNTNFINHLVRGKKRSFEAEHGQYAETHVVDVKPMTGEGAFLNWTLEPKTGRSHQLRVQLAMRGYPIIGDQLYGSATGFPIELSLPPLSISGSAIGLRAVHLDLSKAKELSTIGVPNQLEVFGWS